MAERLDGKQPTQTEIKPPIVDHKAIARREFYEYASKLSQRLCNSGANFAAEGTTLQIRLNALKMAHREE